MLESKSVEFSTPDGSSLNFTLLSVSDRDTTFLVGLRTPWLTVNSEATTYINGPPSSLFTEIAAHWSGWEGKKTWSELEDRVSFIATSDSTGHVTLLTVIRGPNHEDMVEVQLIYEAGSLESMAKKLSNLFEDAT